MSLEHSIALLVVSGAIAFFISGFLLGRLILMHSKDKDYRSRQLELVNAIDRTEEMDSNYTQHQQLMGRHEKLKESFRQLQQENERITQSYSVSMEELRQCQIIRDKYSQEIMQNAKRIAEMESVKSGNSSRKNSELKQEIKQQFEEIERIKQERDSIKKEKLLAEEELTSLKRIQLENTSTLEESKELSSELTKLRQVERELGALKQEYALAMDLLHEQENIQIQKEKLMQEKKIQDPEHNDGIKQNMVMQKNTAELEIMRKENAELKQQLDEFTYIRKHVEDLESENAALRARGIVLSRPEPIKKVWSGEGLAKCLEYILDQVSSFQSNRGAVIADKMGLAVAGIGESIDALAGIAGIVVTIEERIHSLLSIGRLTKVVLIDENNIVCTIFPLSISETSLFLNTLSVGPGPSTQRIVQYVNNAMSFIQEK